MKLGNFAEISVAVPDLSKSLFFFERLGFEKADQNWEPWPWVVLTDGTITLNLSQSTPSEPVLAYLAGDMHHRMVQLEALGVAVTRIEDPQVSELVGALETPSGIGLSFLEYPARRIPRRSGRSTCKCGQFSELAVVVPDLQSSLDFWIRLGFRRERGSSLPYPWAVVSDDLLRMGFYQTRDFDRPALVYSSINLAERIEQLESEGFEFVAQMPSPGDGSGRWILESPGGQLLIFLEHLER